MIDFNISIVFVLLCIFFGVLGQLFRSIIGIYKIYQNNGSIKNFNISRLVISLLLGGCVGLITCLIFNSPLSKTDILCIISSGYAGSDSIEGLLLKK